MNFGRLSTLGSCGGYPSSCVAWLIVQIRAECLRLMASKTPRDLCAAQGHGLGLDSAGKLFANVAVKTLVLRS